MISVYLVIKHYIIFGAYFPFYLPPINCITTKNKLILLSYYGIFVALSKVWTYCFLRKVYSVILVLVHRNSTTIFFVFIIVIIIYAVFTLNQSTHSSLINFYLYPYTYTKSRIQIPLDLFF